MFRGAFHTFLSGAQKPSPHLPQYLYNTNFQKILSCRHNKLVRMSYFSYITNHYYHVTSDPANATKFMKCIKQYRYQKSSLQSATTENERWHTIPRNHFLLWVIQILRIKWYNSFVCTQAHSTHNDYSQSFESFLHLFRNKSYLMEMSF